MARKSQQGNGVGTDKAPATVCSPLDQEEGLLPVCTQSGSTESQVLSAWGFVLFPTILMLGNVRVMLLLCAFSQIS